MLARCSRRHDRLSRHAQGSESTRLTRGSVYPLTPSRTWVQVFSDPTVLTKGGGHLTLPLSMYELFKQQLPLSRRASTISQHDAHEAATGAPTAGAPTVAASRRASLTREAARTASSRPASGPGPTGGRRKGRQRDVPLFYSDCVRGQTRMSARRAAARAAELRRNPPQGEVVHVPMVIFDDRGRPAHSYFEDDVSGRDQLQRCTPPPLSPAPWALTVGCVRMRCWCTGR